MAAKGGAKDGGRCSGQEEVRPKRKSKQASEEKLLDAPQVIPIDWQGVKARVTTQLRRPAPSPRPTRSKQALMVRDGHSIDDVVQEAIAELHAAVQDGMPMPGTLEEIETLLIQKARRRWKAWTKRAREQRINLELLEPTLSIEDMFEVICARDECGKFFGALFEALDPEAQILLETLLRQGIPFHKTEELAKALRTTVPHTTNMKRRLIRQAVSIMTELTSTARAGGKS